MRGKIQKNTTIISELNAIRFSPALQGKGKTINKKHSKTASKENSSLEL